jgi:hypothetical protein
LDVRHSHGVAKFLRRAQHARPGRRAAPLRTHSHVQFEFVIVVRTRKTGCRAKGRGATFKSLRRLTVDHGRFFHRDARTFCGVEGGTGGSTPSNSRKLCSLRLYFFWRQVAESYFAHHLLTNAFRNGHVGSVVVCSFGRARIVASVSVTEVLRNGQEGGNIGA